jgi:hypothetical protein
MLAACGGGGGSGSTPTAQASPGGGAAPVGAGNTAPTISGTAGKTATAGQAYSFTPTAADADHDMITFTIANKPAWAAFDAKTGALRGTPASKDAGAYSGIEIAATDGEAVTALPAFAITVSNPAATSAVSVSWTPPTQNADGSTLTDLSGYRIHYGTQTKSYSSAVTVKNAGVTRYELEALPKGKIYIAMTAVNASGAESDFSSEVSVMVD